MGLHEDTGTASGWEGPRVNRSRDEMMADLKVRPELRVVDYLAGATADQLARLSDPWRPAGVAFVWTAPEVVEGD